MTTTVDATAGSLPPGSHAEQARFASLQAKLGPMFVRVFPNRLAERTVVVIPGMTMDPEQLSKIRGVTHYEERMLCLLMLLRLPRARLVYVTSQPLHPTTVDYYLHLLPGIPARHAKKRLTLLNCGDGSNVPLTAKILARPRLLERIRNAIADPETAHITCFNATSLERTLAVQLGIPLYANDPNLLDLGSKQGGRDVFAAVGVPTPDAVTGVRDRRDLIAALAELRRRRPDAPRVVVKVDEGFSGEGNAIVDLEGIDGGDEGRIGAELTARLTPVARDLTPERFIERIGEMPAIVEVLVTGEGLRAPSAQCRIDPVGEVEVISTHEQVLDDRSGQLYTGCVFPADESYRLDLQEIGRQVGRELAARGVIGRFGLDFASTRGPYGWKHYALEVNLRKGATTLPQLMLQFLTDGTYEPADGTFRSRFGTPLYYYASDNVESPAYRGLLPDDVIDIAVCNGLHFDMATQSGIVFHLLGAVSEFGKLGLMSIAGSAASARSQHDASVLTLNQAVSGELG